MTPQQAAHLRMLESLPKRTHHRTEFNHRKGLAYPQASEELIAKARALDGKMPRKDIARMLGISKATISKKLGRRR